jgi:hypothetical protein
MSINSKSSDVVSFYVALSGISPTDVPTGADKKRVEGFVLKILKQLELQGKKEAPFSLYDRVRLHAAKSKYEELRAKYIFEGVFGPNKVAVLIDQLFSHPKLAAVMEYGYFDPSSKEQSKQNLIEGIRFCLNTIFSEELRNGCWMMIEKVLVSRPDILVKTLQSVSKDPREVASNIEDIYRLTREKQILASLRQKMVCYLMEGLKKEEGDEKRDVIFSSIDPRLRDCLSEDYLNHLLPTLESADQEERKRIYQEVFHVYNLFSPKSCSQLRKELVTREWSALLECVKEITLDPKELAYLIELAYLTLPSSNRLTGFYELYAILLRKNEVPLIWTARDYLEGNVARQLFGAMDMLLIDKNRNMNSVFHLLFSGYGCTEDELLESALQFEPLLQKEGAIDYSLAKFVNDFLHKMGDPRDIAHLLEAFTKLIHRCKCDNSEKEFLFFLVCDSYHMNINTILTKSIPFMNPDIGRILLSAAVYPHVFSGHPVEEDFQSLSLSCRECFMMNALYPGFLSKYLMEKELSFFKNFVRETLVFSRGKIHHLRMKCFPRIPKVFDILYEIGSLDARDGNLVEATEILGLLDRRKDRSELGNLIFHAHIAKEAFSEAEKMIPLAWSDERDQLPYWLVLTEVYLRKNRFAEAERLYLKVYENCLRDEIISSLFTTYLEKGDILSAGRVNGNFSILARRSNGTLQIIKKCIDLEQLRQAKELAILMDHEDHYKDQALLLLINKYTTFGDAVTARGLHWCIKEEECSREATRLILQRIKPSRGINRYFSSLQEAMKLNTCSDEKVMKEIYFGLGPEKWREGIDGEHQKWGKEVYDKGLHGRHIEPGFMQSLENAFAFVGNSLGVPTTVELYLALHRVVCSHFRGEATHTLMGEDKIGVFRDKEMKIHWKGLCGVYSISDEARRAFIGLNLGTISNVIMSYTPMDTCEVERLFTWFLQEYYEEIVKAVKQRQKLTAIAKFTQRCQWLHAPKDGSGRTDTLILNKHLVENGFHPVILEFPYKSSTEPLEKWVDYLEGGLRAWEECQRKLGALDKVLPS